MEILRVGNQRIAYQRMGEGRPIILLHGFPTSSFLFHKMMPRLAHYFEVYAIDLMGYGGSVVRPNDPIHLEAQADMVMAFARQLDLTPFSIVGHDLGGGIAQIIALENPEYLSNIILINSVVAHNFPHWRIKLLIYAIKSRRITHFLEHSQLLTWWGASRFGLFAGVADNSKLDDAIFNRFLVEPFLHSEEGIRRFLRTVETQAENGKITRRIASGLSEIVTPTLILWGEHDRFYAKKWAKLLKKQIPGVRSYVSIPDAGHLSPLEQPELIVTKITEYLGITMPSKK